MFRFLQGYRTKMGVASAILGGLTLILNGLIDQMSGTPGWTKIGAGLLGVGTGLVGAGIRWAPEMLQVFKMLQTIHVNQEIILKQVQAPESPPAKIL